MRGDVGTGIGRRETGDGGRRRPPARPGLVAGRRRGRRRSCRQVRRPRAATLARGARRSRRDGVGGRGPMERRRRPRRARGPPVGASRRHTARPRGDARPARGAERRAVRCAGTHRGRAGVRSQRRARSRHSRALRPLRAGASARHFGAACRVPRRLAGAAVAQAAARVRSPLCHDGPPARRLSVAARVAPARRPGRRDVAARRDRSQTPARGGAARHDRPLGAGRAAGGSVRVTLGGRLALGRGDRRGDLGRPRVCA